MIHFYSLNSFLIRKCFSKDCVTGQIVLHSSVEASTSAFPSGAEGDEVDIRETTSVKKKVVVLFGIFLTDASKV